MFARMILAGLFACTVACESGPAYRYDPIRPDYWPTGGWRLSTPEAQEMDPVQLAGIVGAVQAVAEGDPAAVDRPIIDSLTVVRNGYIVADLYFNPLFPTDTKHIIHSCTKSVTSALIGIAIARGHIESVDVPILEILGQENAVNLDSRKHSITVGDLLTMQTGLRSRDSYLYEWEGLFRVMETRNWTRAALSLPMDVEPGTRFDYSNLSSFLLSAVLTEATGTDALSFAREHLFEPLGIRDVRWEASPEGVYIGWARMWLKPRDMAKIGLLYLQKGRWGDRQIIPAQWVEASTRAHAFPGDYRYITDADGAPDYTKSGGNWIFTNLLRPFSEGYGYQWWLDEGGMYTALGHGGQYIFVVPDENLVVVATGKLKGPDLFLPDQLLRDYIIPAARTPIAAANSGEAGEQNEAARAAMAARSRPPARDAQPREISVLPETALRISGATYVLDENPWGYDRFRFAFDRKQPHAVFSYSARGRSHRLEVGLDHVFRIVATNEDRIAARGSWTAPNTFVIDYEIIGYSNRGRWMLKFEGDRVFVQENGVTGIYEYSGRALQ